MKKFLAIVAIASLAVACGGKSEKKETTDTVTNKDTVTVTPPVNTDTVTVTPPSDTATKPMADTTVKPK